MLNFRAHVNDNSPIVLKEGIPKDYSSGVT